MSLTPPSRHAAILGAQQLDEFSQDNEGRSNKVRRGHDKRYDPIPLVVSVGFELWDNGMGQTV